MNINFKELAIAGMQNGEKACDWAGKYNTPITPLGTVTGSLRGAVALVALVVTTVARVVLRIGCASDATKAHWAQAQRRALHHLGISLLEIPPIGLKWLLTDYFGYDLSFSKPPLEAGPLVPFRSPCVPRARFTLSSTQVRALLEALGSRGTSHPPGELVPVGPNGTPSRPALAELIPPELVPALTALADAGGGPLTLTIEKGSRGWLAVEMGLPQGGAPSRALVTVGGGGSIPPPLRLYLDPAALPEAQRRLLGALLGGELPPFETEAELVSLTEGVDPSQRPSRILGAVGTLWARTKDTFRRWTQGVAHLDALRREQGIDDASWDRFKQDNPKTYKALVDLCLDEGSMLNLDTYEPLITFYLNGNPRFKEIRPQIHCSMPAMPLSRLPLDESSRPSLIIPRQRRNHTDVNTLLLPWVIPRSGLFSEQHIVLIGVDFQNKKIVFFDSKGLSKANEPNFFRSSTDSLLGDLQILKTSLKTTEGGEFSIHLAPQTPTQISESNNCGMHVFNAIRTVYENTLFPTREGPMRAFIANQAPLREDMAQIRMDTGRGLLTLLAPLICEGLLFHDAIRPPLLDTSGGAGAAAAEAACDYPSSDDDE